MIRYESTTTIARGPDEIFSWLVEPDRMTQWTGMSDGSWLTDGPPRAGSRAQATMRFGPLRRQFRWEITDLVPGRRVAFRALPHGPMTWTSSYELEPNGGETVVTTKGEASPNGLLRLLHPMIRAELPKEEAQELVRLKALLEGPGGTTDAGR